MKFFGVSPVKALILLKREGRLTASSAFTAPRAKYRNFASHRLFFSQHWQPRVDIERNGALRIGELKAAPK
jgi:hypothetical protein